MKKALKIAAWVAGVLLLLCVLLITPIDRRPYGDTDYYQRMTIRLDSFETAYRAGRGDTVRAGWAASSLVYPSSIPLAGYGKRKGAHYTGVHDSVQVKTIVFDNGVAKAAIVSLDLLITPPEVILRLEKRLPALGYSLQNTFFTAVHTHCSIGAWSPGLTGRLFAGSYQPEVADFIAGAILQSIRDAETRLEKARIGFLTFDAGELMYNRLVGHGTVDPWFRVLKIEKDSGETALFTTFAAHATTLPASFMELSADYPGALTEAMAADSLADFVVYGAGAVGSTGPAVPRELSGWERAKHISENLTLQYSQIAFLVSTEYTTELSSGNLPLELRDPHFKISENLRVRPWVFYWLFGNYKSSISYLQIGQNLLIGTPCDFSGELVSPLDSLARSQGQNLLITSFNGGYVGYITKDERYDLNKYETRVMNWFGPYNGAYFSEIISRIIEVTK